jgi:cyclophilin family peptidyl-prolyl cis-trans isomerase
MDNETKITYSVIAVLIVFLGGLALMLQPTPALPETTATPQVTTPKAASVPVAVATTTATSTVAASTTPNTSSTTTTMEQPKTFSTATITTNKGVIEIALNKATPNTIKNFGTLANSKFYEGVRFHRVIKDFMIQAGDPLSKDPTKMSMWGTGGPGYKFNDELTGAEQYPLGTVAMANSGPNTNGSQFFIVTANPSVGLPPSYTVFGKVTKGMDVALAIQGVKTNGSDRPLEDVIIEKVEAR